MYELVNTSLPNGLIAGTHGFATVAMTKGMPDSLRMRVEAYCGYRHRSSAHDETYYSENPVNWFHAILPQGEHVVGRAAPAEFDYTGRTNRLARVLVFGKDKMPLAGGVTVLLKEAKRLQEPWAGDARWLEEDKAAESRLRSEPLPAAKDAPSWRKKFGDSEGLALAKGFARLLAKNISSGGKAIYFKTSAAHDVSGGELLYLYADIINLLSVEMRGRATFSTYPAALPNGAICHLRGVYDRDRAFDMAKVAQPWVDCENNTVHNAAMLPKEEIEPQKPMSKSSGGKAITTESRPRRTQSNNIKQYLPVDRKKQDPLIWIFAAIAGVIVVGFVSFILMMIISTKKSQPTTREDDNVNPIRKLGEGDATDSKKNNDPITVTNSFQKYYDEAKRGTDKKVWDVAEIKRLFEELSTLFPSGETPKDYHSLTNEMQFFLNQEEKLNSIKKEIDNVNSSQKLNELKNLKSRIDELRKQLKHGLKLDDKRYTKICNLITTSEKPENATTSKAKARKELSLFMDAKKVEVGMPPMPKETNYNKAKSGAKSVKVYYYRNEHSSLTNETAFFKPSRDPAKRQNVISWTIEGGGWKISSESPHPVFSSCLILWLQDDTVYFDWSHCRDRNKGGKVWFASGETYDLKQDCFGDNDDVFKKWCEKCSPVRYIVKWDVLNKQANKEEKEEENASKPIAENKFSIQHAIELVKQDAIKPKKKDVADKERKLTDLDVKINEVKTNITAIAFKMLEYQNLTNKINYINNEIKSIKKKLKGNVSDSEFDKNAKKKPKKKLSKKERNELESDQKRLSGEREELKKKAGEFDIKSLELQKEQYENKLKSHESDKETAKKALERAKEELKDVRDNPNSKAEIREKRFRVEVEGGNR